jgi:uncharacterized protein YjiS (DUF1127 family)
MLRQHTYPEVSAWRGSVPAVAVSRTGHRGFAQVLTRLSDLYFAWEDRVMQRRTLMHFDEHQLKDIGLTRGVAEQEWRKPFWRP